MNCNSITRAQHFGPVFRVPIVVLLLLYILILCLPTRVAAVEKLKRSQVEAGLIYKFISFIEWPETPVDKQESSSAKPFRESEAPFVIGVIGNDLFAESFTPVAGHPVKDRRKLVVELINQKDNSLMDLEKCQILYLSAPDRARMIKLLELVQGLPVVTVSSMEGFVDMGGMIGFSEQQGRLKFSINNRVARAGGIRISAKLMRVAVRVVGVGNEN